MRKLESCHGKFNIFFQMASSVGFEKPDSLGLVLNQEFGSKKTKIKPVMCRQKLKLLKKWSRNWFLFPLFLKAFSLAWAVDVCWSSPLMTQPAARKTNESLKNEDSNLSFLFQSLNCYHGWNLKNQFVTFCKCLSSFIFQRYCPSPRKSGPILNCPAKIIFVLTWRSD